MDDGRAVAVFEGQTIPTMAGCGLIGKARFMEGPKKPVPASIPGEDPTGAVSSMGGGG